MIWGELVSPVTLTSSAWSSGVLCQIDLFERHAPLAKQRLRVDAEGAGVGGEENDAARHVDENRKAGSVPRARRGHGRALGVDGVDYLGVLDALRVDRGGAEVGVAQLTLDDVGGRLGGPARRRDAPERVRRSTSVVRATTCRWCRTGGPTFISV